MDWASRKVLAWKLSNTLAADSCVVALEEALARYGTPEIFNTDQGSQFTSTAFTDVLKAAGIRISMDGRGRWMDNVFIERLWRSLKYECVYLYAFETGSQLRAGIGRWTWTKDELSQAAFEYFPTIRLEIPSIDSPAQIGTEQEQFCSNREARRSWSAMAREQILADLRALVAHVEADGRTTRAVLPFGLERIDSHLPGGGLTLGALHEVAGGASIAEQGAAMLFAAGIAARLTGPVLWCLRSRDLFAPALQAVGLDPDRTIFAEAPDEAAVLAVMEEGLRHAGLAIVVGELSRLPLVASRRLQLAAESSGVTALALLRWQKDGTGQPSAGGSRWRVTPLPSEALSVPSLARPRWHVALERCRGAAPAAWDVEACDETGHLHLSADLAHRPPAAAGQSAAA